MTPTHPIPALSNELAGSIVQFAVDWPSVDFSFGLMMPSCVPFRHFSCGKSLATSKDIATKHPATAIMDASMKASRSILRPSFHIGLYHLNFKTITTKSRLRILKFTHTLRKKNKTDIPPRHSKACSTGEMNEYK